MNGLILILIIIIAWLSTYLFEKIILSLHDILYDFYRLSGKIKNLGTRSFFIKKTVHNHIQS